MSNSSRLWQVLKLGLLCIRLKISGRGNELPRIIYVRFRQLGGVYIKFLQLLVLQSDAFRSLSDYDLYDVYDQADCDPVDIHALLRYELGEAAAQLHLHDTQPFAAGSFGQVYKASYKDQDVIIKVLRPSVQRSLAFDLRLLGWMSRFIDLLSPGGATSATRIYKGLAKVTRAETDYVLEADYASKLYNRYRDHRYLYIPYTFRNLSTNHIICQEYVGGVAATDLLRLKEQGISPRDYIADTTGSDLVVQMTAFGTEFLYSAFAYGTTYGDPHPGNIKFMSDNRIALIDYGLQAAAPKNLPAFQQLVEQYDNIYSGRPDIKAYSQALLDVYGGDIIQAVRSLEAHSYGSSTTVIDTMVQSVEALLANDDTQTKELLEDNRLSYLFNNVINKNNRFCLKYDVDGPEFIRASILFTKLTRLFDINQEVLQPTYSSVVTRIHTQGFTSQERLMHPETALEVVAAWLDQVSYKNPQLHQQLIRGGVRYVF